MDIREVGVVGLGTMGAGIAEVFARGGLRVTAVEADPQALARGMSILDGSLRKAVSRGRLTQDEHAQIMGRVNPGQAVASLSGADLVIEVVPEQLAIKRQVIAELDQALPAGGDHRDEHLVAVGHHDRGWFGAPRPGRGHALLQPGAGHAAGRGRDDGADRARGRTRRHRAGRAPRQDAGAGHRPGRIRRQRALLPYLNHAVRLFETGHASRDDIDLAVTAGMGLPMGPLALLDLIGLDTSLAVLEVLEREFGGTRFTPAPLLRRLTDAGRTGRKSGAGFYDYTGAAARRHKRLDPGGSRRPAGHSRHGHADRPGASAGAGNGAAATGKRPGRTRTAAPNWRA